MYPRIELEYEHKNLSIENIEEFERVFLFTISEQYKQFLLCYSGSTIDADFKYFISKDDENNYINYISFLNLESLYEWQELVNEISRQPIDNNYTDLHIYKNNSMLKIADANIGNVILCICYKNNEDFGKIYSIDDIHEQEFILLATNFDEFINNFEYIPE